MSSLDQFQIEEVIGLGGASVVFSAFVKNAHRDFGVSLKVALKIAKDSETARQEVASLAQVAPISQFCDLHDAFLVSREDLYRFAEEQLAAIEAYIGQELFPAGIEQVSVIVLNLVPGEKIVKREQLKPGDVPEKGSWLVRGVSATWSEKLTDRVAALDKKARMALLLELVKAVAKRHEFRESHGDLNPGNVLWNPQMNELTLIDLGLRGNYGVPGWCSPEHEQLRAGKIQQVPLASDIYVLGIWTERILAENRSPLAALIRKCKNEDPKKRPTAQEVHGSLRHQYYSTHYKKLFFAAVLIICILGYSLWKQVMPPSLDDLFPNQGLAYIQKIKNLNLKNTANPKPIRLEIQQYL